MGPRKPDLSDVSHTMTKVGQSVTINISNRARVRHIRNTSYEECIFLACMKMMYYLLQDVYRIQECAYILLPSRQRAPFSIQYGFPKTAGKKYATSRPMCIPCRIPSIIVLGTALQLWDAIQTREKSLLEWEVIADREHRHTHTHRSTHGGPSEQAVGGIDPRQATFGGLGRFSGWSGCRAARHAE